MRRAGGFSPCRETYASRKMGRKEYYCSVVRDICAKTQISVIQTCLQATPICRCRRLVIIRGVFGSSDIGSRRDHSAEHRFQLRVRSPRSGCLFRSRLPILVSGRFVGRQEAFGHPKIRRRSAAQSFTLCDRSPWRRGRTQAREHSLVQFGARTKRTPPGAKAVVAFVLVGYGWRRVSSHFMSESDLGQPLVKPLQQSEWIPRRILFPFVGTRIAWRLLG
jgi:hypothetical protein